MEPISSLDQGENLPIQFSESEESADESPFNQSNIQSGHQESSNTQDGYDSDTSPVEPLTVGVESLQLEQAIFSGFLKKKGERRKNWKKRWFVLRPTRLTYYKNENEYELLTIIELSDIRSIASVDFKKRPFCFIIVTRSRTYYFQAPTEPLRNHWVSILTQQHSKLTNEMTPSSRSISFTTLSSPMFKQQSLPQAIITASSAPSEPSPIAHDAPLLSASHPTPTLSDAFLGSSPPKKEFDPTIKQRVSIATTHSQLTVATTISPLESPLQPKGNSQLSGILNKAQMSNERTVSFNIPMDNVENHVKELHPPAAIQTPTLSSLLSETILSSDEDELETPIQMNQYPLESQDSVIKQGYLKKQSSQLGKPFKKRWFVLRKSCTLTIYKNSTEYAALHVIPLSQVLDIIDIDLASKSHPFCFKLIDPNRELIIAAESRQEMQEWIDALVEAKSNATNVVP